MKLLKLLILGFVFATNLPAPSYRVVLGSRTTETYNDISSLEGWLGRSWRLEYSEVRTLRTNDLHIFEKYRQDPSGPRKLHWTFKETGWLRAEEDGRYYFTNGVTVDIRFISRSTGAMFGGTNELFYSPDTFDEKEVPVAVGEIVRQDGPFKKVIENDATILVDNSNDDRAWDVMISYSCQKSDGTVIGTVKLKSSVGANSTTMIKPSLSSASDEIDSKVSYMTLQKVEFQQKLLQSPILNEGYGGGVVVVNNVPNQVLEEKIKSKKQKSKKSAKRKETKK